MATTIETLKVNDYLSPRDIDVIYENGEKYVKFAEMTQPNLCSENEYINRKKYMSYYTTYPEFIVIKDRYINVQDVQGVRTIDNSHSYNIIEFYIFEYTNSLSLRINNELCYEDLVEYGGKEYSIYELWNEVDLKRIVDSWAHRYPTYIIEDRCPSFCTKSVEEYAIRPSTEILLFPFEIDKDYDRYIHFDIFIFLLYLKYPEYKNDLIRFLKYQPICTKSSEGIYIQTLKQTNKDLLKQLNDTNLKLLQINKLELEIQSHEAIIKDKNIEIGNLNSRIIDLTNSSNNLNARIKELTNSSEELKKKIENLSKVEDENKEYKSKLQSTEELLENEKINSSQWRDKYLNLKQALQIILDEN